MHISDDRLVGFLDRDEPFIVPDDIRLLVRDLVDARAELALSIDAGISLGAEIASLKAQLAECRSTNQRLNRTAQTAYADGCAEAAKGIASKRNAGRMLAESQRDALQIELDKAREDAARRQCTNLELVELSKELENERDAQVAEREALIVAVREALEEAEWSEFVMDDDGGHRECPVCGAIKQHESDCVIHVALADSATVAAAHDTALTARVRRAALEEAARACDNQASAECSASPSQMFMYDMAATIRALAASEP